MRFSPPSPSSCLLPAAAFADSAVTTVDDEPIPHGRRARAGARADAHAARRAPRAVRDRRAARRADIAAPGAVAIDDAAPVAHEHDVAPAYAAAAAATDGDVMTELAHAAR